MKSPCIAQRDVTLHILKTFHLSMSKKLGQNFLIDPSVVQSIVDAAEIEATDHVLEVGPGIGTLTQGLAETEAQVVAVELDKKLLPVLAKTLDAYDNVKIVPGDILKIDIPREMATAPYKVVANLPYYITTPIIMKLLEERLPISLVVTMIQREVALRMVAKPGGKDYGALSVAVQYYTEPEIVFDVSPKSFIPAPAVTSSVIRCRVRTAPPVAVADEKLFFRVVKAAFAQRRKTLGNSLKSGSFSADEVKEMLHRAAIDGSRRGETLSLQEFGDLANAYTAMQNLG
ncbi:MAG: 16S rRNA (adenine(1518)-N(6)/adenine(1519)-N(6))-dimethyltransferase RsmA [Sporomusaceae bacterium]|nr:16S rRNA (adenine(1518)-N(6)/adenine(1519)-N(6))-dimethyltransferase RsmA [Sporomusaceae bacterium]